MEGLPRKQFSVHPSALGPSNSEAIPVGGAFRRGGAGSIGQSFVRETDRVMMMMIVLMAVICVFYQMGLLLRSGSVTNYTFPIFMCLMSSPNIPIS